VGEGLARAIVIGSIALTAASLTLAVVCVRKRSRIRPRFDLTRAVVGVGAVLVMAEVTHVTTPWVAVDAAIAVGLALGFAQGSALEISRGERGFYARRSPAGVVLWGVGIVMMQAAGIASRTGTVRIGQTLAWFSACLGIGLMVGRTRPMKRTLAGVGVVTLIAALMLPAATLIGGTATPVAAQSVQLTDEEVCGLPPATRITRPGHPGVTDPLSPLAPVETALAACRSIGYFDYTGLSVDFTVYLFASEDDALAQWQGEAMATNEWFSSWYESSTAGITDNGYDPTVDYNAGGLNAFGVSGAWYSVMGVEDRVVMKAGPFMLLGVADNIGFELGEVNADGAREPITLIEELITPMVETVGRIEDWLAGESPPPNDYVPDSATLPDAGGTTPTDVTSVPPADQSGSPQGGDEGPGGTDEPIEPEEAAAQAIAGLIAAAAIGVISWTEATGEIGDILGGRAPLPEPPDPFIDPYDRTPLQTDPDTGMVFWPWDGGDGHWVNAAQVPALLDEWNRELDAETARRVSRHDAQRDQNWQDLQDRIRRSAAAAAGRRAAEQARLDDFDRRVKAARTWMEEADAGSLGQLDRIMQRVADQGYATDEDLDRARRIADRARVWADTKQRWDADDWVRIERNKATVVEIAAKGAAIIIDPTKGIASGFIFGATESWQRGDSMATVVGNGVFDAAMFRGTHAIGTWAPGRAAMGKVGWGSFSGSLTAAGETLLRGGSLEDALHAAKIGFVAGGMGGIAEEAAGAGTRPAGQLPTIRTQRGGPQVGYDTPSQPSLRPPERGGVSWSDPSVPGIRVEPGGSRPHYDQPLSPRHIDPQDPRYVPPGTPAEEIHLPPSDWSRPPPQIDEMPGPLGGRPPSTPSPPQQGIEPGNIDLSDLPPPVEVPGTASPPAYVPDGVPSPVDLAEATRPPRLVPEEGPIGGGGKAPPADPAIPLPTSTPPPDLEPPPAAPSDRVPDVGPDQELMEAVLRGEKPPGAALADDVELLGEERFSGTAHADEGGWSPEAIGREERFWNSDGSLISGPGGVDVEPPPKGFIIQVNPRTRTATPKLGTALTHTERTRLLQPGGPVEEVIRRINQNLDNPGSSP